MKLHNIAGLCAGVSIFCMSPVVAFASTQSTQPQSQSQLTGSTQTGPTQSVSQKAIALNQQTISKPYGTVHDGTTYMPIWYLMNALQKLGVEASWDGKNLQLTGVPGLTPDLKQVNPGSGSMAIYLNGELVQKVDGSTAVDPAANQQTTYMPLWYLMQALNRMQVGSDWDGVTWDLKSPESSSSTSATSTVNGTSGTTGSFAVATESLNTRSRAVSSTNSPDLADTSISLGTSDTSNTSASTTTANAANTLNTADTPSTSGASATSNPSVDQSSSSSSSNAGSSSSASSTAVSGQNIVNYAKQFIGTPYVYGGTTASGFDCSGFVKTVFAHYSISLPRTAAEQAQVGQVISKSSLQPGDLVFFNTTGAVFSHVGIYVGNGQFISATTSKGVRICSVSDPYYWGAKFTRATNPQG